MPVDGDDNHWPGITAHKAPHHLDSTAQPWKSRVQPGGQSQSQSRRLWARSPTKPAFHLLDQRCLQGVRSSQARFLSLAVPTLAWPRCFIRDNACSPAQLVGASQGGDHRVPLLLSRRHWTETLSQPIAADGRLPIRRIRGRSTDTVMLLPSCTPAQDLASAFHQLTQGLTPTEAELPPPRKTRQLFFLLRCSSVQGGKQDQAGGMDPPHRIIRVSKLHPPSRTRHRRVPTGSSSPSAQLQSGPSRRARRGAG